MTKICSQTTIPSVNEDAPDCPEAIKEQCVFMTSDRVTPIIINENEDFQTVFNRLLVYIGTLEARILTLETP